MALFISTHEVDYKASLTLVALERALSAPSDFLKPLLLKQRKIRLHFVFPCQEWSGHRAE